MSLFDDVVSRATCHSRTSSQVGRAMGVVRSLRDKRVCAHVVGCYPVQKKQGLELVLYTDSALWAQECTGDSCGMEHALYSGTARSCCYLPAL